LQIKPTSRSASHDYEMNNDSPTFTENQLSFVQQKMIQAYGVPLLNTEGEWTNDIWENIWKRIATLTLLCEENYTHCQEVQSVVNLLQLSSN
jgi:hypothetical protein